MSQHSSHFNPPINNLPYILPQCPRDPRQPINPMTRINRLHGLILDLSKVPIGVLFARPQKRTQDIWPLCERGDGLCEHDDGLDVDHAALVRWVEAVDAAAGVEDEPVRRCFERDCWQPRGEAPSRAGPGDGCVGCSGSQREGHCAMRQLLEALNASATTTSL
jgi:hypothetical protein